MTSIAPHRCNPRDPTDKEGSTSVFTHRNAPAAEQAPVDGLICTAYTLDVCVVCRHERVHAPRQQTSCRRCGATNRRSFVLYRDLREVQQ